MILISACLCGVNCKYSGGNNLSEPLLKLLKEGKAVLFCPEQAGGLETPRKPCEIVGGTSKDVLKDNARVLNVDGEDKTAEFIKGAYETLRLAQVINAEYVILKGKSPSCGIGKVYDGTFSGALISGNGITAELLIQNGFKVINEEDYEVNSNEL